MIDRTVRNNRGFSLTEMLVVIGIIIVMGIVLSFSYWNVLNKEQLAGSTDALYSMISSTRQSAVASREHRWLEINLAGDSLQMFKKVYVYDRDSGIEHEDYESITPIERTSADITDITTASEEPLDMDVWQTITERQLPIRLEFDPRGSMVGMSYRSVQTGLWEELAVENPVIHVYILSRSSEDEVSGTEIELSGKTLPYRDPHGSRNDVLNYSDWRTRLQVLPSDSSQRRKCYSIRIYQATGRPFTYEYGLGYPWPSTLMPERS